MWWTRSRAPKRSRGARLGRFRVDLRRVQAHQEHPAAGARGEQGSRDAGRCRRCLHDEAEKDLAAQVPETANKVEALRAERNYEAALLEISQLRPAVDHFFDKVMVMVDDEKVRANRLALLQTLLKEFSTIADFTEIVTEGKESQRISETVKDCNHGYDNHSPKTRTMEIETSPRQTTVKYVYFFGGGKAEGNGKMKDVLGGKGAGLAEMTNAGLPVPPGFTIQTEACREYMRTNAVSKEVDRQMDEALDAAWRSCRARSSARATIRCWSACAPAQSSPCPA